MTKFEREQRRQAGKCIGGIRCKSPRVDGQDRCREHMRWNLKRWTGTGSHAGKAITFNGLTLNQRGWAEKLNISEQSLLWRMRHWSMEKALTTSGALYNRVRGYTPPSERMLKIVEGPRCGRCGLLEPHECTMAIEFYASRRPGGRGDASTDVTRKGVGKR